MFKNVVRMFYPGLRWDGGGGRGGECRAQHVLDLYFFPLLFYPFRFFYRSSPALYHLSSTQILLDYWGTFCAGGLPNIQFLFLVAAGFKPTSLWSKCGRLNATLS